MSRAPTSCSGRSGNPKIAGSSLEPAGLKPGRVKPRTLKLTLLGWDKDWLDQCQNNVIEWVQQVMVPMAWCPSAAAL